MKIIILGFGVVCLLESEFCFRVFQYRYRLEGSKLLIIRWSGTSENSGGLVNSNQTFQKEKRNFIVNSSPELPLNSSLSEYFLLGKAKHWILGLKDCYTHAWADFVEKYSLDMFYNLTVKSRQQHIQSKGGIIQGKHFPWVYPVIHDRDPVHIAAG